jgi:hypothetical protein
MERVRAQGSTRRAGAARLAAAATLLALLTAGCGGRPPTLPSDATSDDPAPAAPADAWGRLAARVAAAQDKRYVAGYTLATRGRPDRSVSVTVAQDGSWLVNVPDGALSGTADVAVADSAAGLYQCAVGGASPGCVRVAGPGGHLPARLDPWVEHLFTDWLSVLTDRQVAISVDTATPIPGARGQCFSVEPSSASLAPPVDPGIYCYDADGTLTAATISAGTLLLTGAPMPAPATVALPAPVVPRDPLPTDGPPQAGQAPSAAASGPT